jgi:hypothetical protein
MIPNVRISAALRSFARTSYNKSCAIATHKRLSAIKPDLVICETNAVIDFVTLPRTAKVQVLDLPCPWAEELYYGGHLTERGFQKMKAHEVEAYRQADALSFHWHTYSNFVKKSKYNGNNIIDMGYGTDKKRVVAKYANRPRIIFLGKLDGYWVNMKLLEEIVKLCPNVDVYGGPQPPEHVNVNYRGYAPTLDVMADYQFGLTTITDDELRKNSFSSKHLEYASYGLPVFTPSWRRDSKLDASSIYYDNAHDLVKKLEKYSSRDEWHKKHDDAMKTAGDLSWDKAFTELDELLKKNDLL